MADIQAVFERDAACDRYTQCILYFKGFQAIQCHRIAHWLWTRNRRVRPRAAQPFPARGSLLGSAVRLWGCSAPGAGAVWPHGLR